MSDNIINVGGRAWADRKRKLTLAGARALAAGDLPAAGALAEERARMRRIEQGNAVLAQVPPAPKRAAAPAKPKKLTANQLRKQTAAKKAANMAHLLKIASSGTGTIPLSAYWGER